MRVLSQIQNKMKTKRILIVYYATYGSTGAYINDLLLAFVQNDCSNVDVAVSAYYKFPDYPRLGKIYKVFFKFTERVPENKYLENWMIRKFRRPIRSLELIFNYLWLIVLALRNKVDSINFHLIDDYIPTYLFILTLKILGFEIIITAHDIHSLGIKRTPKRRYLLLKIVDLILVHNDHSVELLIHDFSIPLNKIRIMAYPLYSFSGILDSNNVNELVALYRMKYKNRKIFLFAGWIRKEKGIDILINAWVKGMSSCKDCLLLIVGEPSIDVSALQILTANCDNVVWITRRVSDEELIGFMTVSDVVVLPYRDYSNSALIRSAYVNAKKAAIVSNIPLFTSLINQRIAFLFNKDDVDSLINVLNIVASTPTSKITEMGIEGFLHFQKNADILKEDVLGAYY
jgi:glycosyltransferase involved in cell wall biosynthesis